MFERSYLMLWKRSERLAARGSDLFRSTFGVWNEEHFNARQSIGYSMKLIKECKPENPTDWEFYYLNSGITAKEMKEAIPDIYEERTMNRMLRTINVNYGKTMDDLKEIGKRFRKSLERNGIHVTDEQAFNYVYIRAIDEAWIGYQRELAAEKALKEFCQKEGLICRPTSVNYDVRKGVDWEILRGDNVLCGVQVKGTSYKKAVMDSAQVKSYDNNLKEQNADYTKRTGAPVFYLFVMKNLDMENMKTFEEKVLNLVKPIEKEEKEEEHKENKTSKEEGKALTDYKRKDIHKPKETFQNKPLKSYDYDERV